MAGRVEEKPCEELDATLNSRTGLFGVSGVSSDYRKVETATRNESCEPDSDIATTDSPGRILVIHTRENLMIAREARHVVFSGAP